MSPVTTPTRRRATFHPLTVSRIDRLTDAAVAVSFAVPEGLREEFAFEPGQHLTLRAEIDGQDVRRSYSVCLPRSRWAEHHEVRVAVARVEGGLMSGWANDTLAVGDVVDVMTPMGTFVCPTQPDAARHHVAIAAGSGITPVMALLATALEEEPSSQATLIFGNRRTDSVMFLEEISDLKNAYGPRFQVFHVLSREPQEVELLNGRIDREKLERFLAAVLPVGTVDEWYLCGPYAMVESARELLAERGVEAAHVHHEVFHVDELGAAVPPQVQTRPEQARDGAPPEAVVTVTLDGRTSLVDMPTKDGETILAATLRERPDAPYSCTGGVCGTCRSKVVEGQVRMERNYALEPDEVEKGYVLACQAHPVSDTVTLDYDV